MPVYYCKYALVGDIDFEIAYYGSASGSEFSKLSLSSKSS